MPRVAAASASAAAWFPEECAATPRRASVSDNDCTAFVAPRYLNAPTRCRCSAFTNTCAPTQSSSERERSTGVWCTNGAMRAAASSIRARSILMATGLVAGGQRAFQVHVEGEQRDQEGEHSDEPRERVTPAPEGP